MWRYELKLCSIYAFQLWNTASTKQACAETSTPPDVAVAAHLREAVNLNDPQGCTVRQFKIQQHMTNASTRLQQSSWSWLKLNLTHLVSCSCYYTSAPGSDRDAPAFGLLDWGTWKSNFKPSSPFISRHHLSFLLGRPYFLKFKLKVRLVWQSSSIRHRIVMSHLASKCQNCKTSLF